jgi:hypothetical protein
MRRIATVIAAIVVLLVVASQLALPPLVERAARNRLTRDGGSAELSVSALPALRLLFGHGDSLHVDGRGITLPTEGGEEGLSGLDKFGEVHVSLRDSSAGPVSIRSFRLERPHGADHYEARLSGRTSPRDVAAFLGSRAGGSLGALLGELAAGAALPGGSATKVPLELRASVNGDGVHAAAGTVAGIPAGPLIQLVLDAALRRL